ncbi:MAG: hypothetical protein K8S54_09990 [Spirochaetia bacterium]|nr:hypothetical protein [Spirochaetia bacterium]
MNTQSTIRILKIVLTIGAMEFFGPAIRDSDVSHLQNPAWPGHAKVHMMWFIAYLFFSGTAQIYLIWFRKPSDPGLALGWQLCNLLAFWSAVVLAPFYGGAVIDGVYHTQILGINENILAFSLFTIVWIIALSLFTKLRKAGHA